MQYLRIICFSVLACCFMAVFSHGQRYAWEQNDHDPVVERYKDYKKISFHEMSEEEKVAKKAEWQRLLVDVVRENPTSPATPQVRLELVRLCVDLMGNDSSHKIFEEMINDESIPLWERYTLQN